MTHIIYRRHGRLLLSGVKIFCFTCNHAFSSLSVRNCAKYFKTHLLMLQLKTFLQMLNMWMQIFARHLAVKRLKLKLVSSTKWPRWASKYAQTTKRRVTRIYGADLLRSRSIVLGLYWRNPIVACYLRPGRSRLLDCYAFFTTAYLFCIATIRACNYCLSGNWFVSGATKIKRCYGLSTRSNRPWPVWLPRHSMPTMKSVSIEEIRPSGWRSFRASLGTVKTF